mgnify:CR=1 FL=1
MPIELPVKGTPPKEWTVTGRFVLVSIVLFFLVVAGVNAIMMTLAIRTFPGADARNGYDVSQAYNREIAAARQQAERGWSSDIRLVRVDGSARLSLTLKDRGGVAVSGLAIEAQLAHPSDKRKDHGFDLKEIAPGVYEADEPGLSGGAWDIRLSGTRGGERLYSAHARTILG